MTGILSVLFYIILLYIFVCSGLSGLLHVLFTPSICLPNITNENRDKKQKSLANIPSKIRERKESTNGEEPGKKLNGELVEKVLEGGIQKHMG